MGDLKRTLLAVLAHPDDESFGMGGTLALYARRGVDVHVICATRGEAGEMGGTFLEGYSDASERRISELTCAAEKLGLAGVHFLNYRDSGMTGSPENDHPQALVNAPIEEVAGEVVHFIRKLRPQVVVTFDPIGGYKHPDHIAMHEATVLAFEAAGDPGAYPGDLPPYRPQKLYYHTISRTFLRIGVRLIRLFGRDPTKWGQNQDINIAELADVEFPVHAEVDFRSVRKLKQEASACHESQGGSAMIRGLMGLIVRLTGFKETYMREQPPPVEGVIERDLFAGIH